MFHAKLSTILVALVLLTAPAFAADGSTAADLSLNATERAYAGADDTAQLYRLSLPSPGILTVDLATAGPERTAAKIEISREASLAGARILEQSATHLVLAARVPMTLWLHAAAEDPRQALGRYKLITGFAAAEVVDETFALGASGRRATQTSYLASEASWKSDPEPVDPDPDSATAGGRTLASFLTTRTEGLVQKSDPEPVDPDPDSATLGGRSGVDSVLFYRPTCARSNRGERDDHGDTASCATPLVPGDAAAGEIMNAWGDDADVFELVLSELATVEITSSGDTDTFGMLSDRFGQRLAADDDGAGDGNFRIVRTLAPGRYFVRVDGGEGAYELAVTK